VTKTFHAQLATYFASRRWFAGKGRTFEVTDVDALPWMQSADPLVRIEVVTVRYSDGKQDTYQIPIAYLDEPDETMAHAFVGDVDEPELGRVSAYDAVYFKDATDILLAGFHARETTDEVEFHVVEGAELPSIGAPGTVMTGEQSNTSIAYGDEGILKLFRRISPGGNPDIEIHEALTRHGGGHVAPLLGWISGRWRDANGEACEGHLGMLQEFLRTATDGWVIALSSVRDLLVEEDLHPEDVGADFAAEAERLGEATASVHADLARLFESTTFESEQREALAAAMALRLEAAMAVVPELEPLADGLRSRYAALADLDTAIPAQRIHGDLHLGQTLRTVKGWKIIDFEGEPAKSLEERVALDSPLRDVAGMLRSFDYAAGATLREFGTVDHLSYRADEWTQRNRKAFLQGYSATSGVDVDQSLVVLHAYETDKAVYEAVYEARNRPSWLSIPLRAAARLASEE
jgi:maltokinase